MLSESSPAFQISAPIFPAGVVRIEHTVYCFENWETQHVHICRLLRLLKKWSRSWSLMECHCWLCRKTLISVLKLPISAHFDIVHFQLKRIIWRHSIIESCVSKEKSQELHMETLHNTFLLKIQSQLTLLLYNKTKWCKLHLSGITNWRKKTTKQKQTIK